MRSIHTLVAAAALLTSLGGCGAYTNIPAQIVVAEVKPGKVTYTVTNTDGAKQTSIEEPSVTLRGDPGSLGVTYNTMNVKYYDIASNQLPSTSIPSMKLGLTVRVESSVFPNDPLAVGEMNLGDVGQKDYVGRYSFSPPILTRHVEEYGASSDLTKGNQAAVYAEVELVGADDANWPADLIFFVPIIFSGSPTP